MNAVKRTLISSLIITGTSLFTVFVMLNIGPKLFDKKENLVDLKEDSSTSQNQVIDSLQLEIERLKNSDNPNLDSLTSIQVQTADEQISRKTNPNNTLSPSQIYSSAISELVKRANFEMADNNLDRKTLEELRSLYSIKNLSDEQNKILKKTIREYSQKFKRNVTETKKTSVDSLEGIISDYLSNGYESETHKKILYELSEASISNDIKANLLSKLTSLYFEHYSERMPQLIKLGETAKCLDELNWILNPTNNISTHLNTSQRVYFEEMKNNLLLNLSSTDDQKDSTESSLTLQESNIIPSAPDTISFQPDSLKNDHNKH